jgi:integrase/recombinase XerC
MTRPRQPGPPVRALARREQTAPSREQTPGSGERGELVATPIPRGKAHLLDRWLKTKSPPTVRAYEEDLRRFADWAVAAERMPEPATSRAVVAWLLSLTAEEASEAVYDYRADLLARTPKRAARDGRKTLAPATINRRLSAIRSVIAAGQDLHYIDWSIRIAGVDDPDKPPLKPIVVDGEEVADDADYGRKAVIRLRAYLDALCDSERERERTMALRDRAIVRLLYDCALRRMEVVGFDWPEHVDLRRGLLHVLGKVRETREPFPLDEPVAIALRAWIGARGRVAGPLFVPLDYAHRSQPELKRLSLGGINKIITRVREGAGVMIRPHDLRRVSITRALELHGGNAAKILPFSRHKDLATLAKYNLLRADLPREIAKTIARDDEETE